MTNRPRTPRWIARTALAGACVLSALSVVSVVANSWGQSPSPAQVTPAAKGAAPRPGNDRDGPDTGQALDAMEVLEAQIEAKRSLVRIDESRAEQAKRWRAYYEKMVREGRVIEDRMLAARDDVLMMDAHVVAEQADLKVAEIRVKYAQRHPAQAPRRRVAPNWLGRSWTNWRPCSRRSGPCSGSASRVRSRRGGRRPITRSCSEVGWPPRTWCSLPGTTSC